MFGQVPIYGASFSTANHPLLLRALFVDGASYPQTDFMTNLISFAFMLRNAGIDDQQLVEHLSEATAGSLTGQFFPLIFTALKADEVSGLGHSTPYEEAQSYDLAVQYLFLSGPAKQPMTPLAIEPFSARDARNDFELPWIMRALVDSKEVQDLFPDELKALKEGILAWKPLTKPLKDIKKRVSRLTHCPHILFPYAIHPFQYTFTQQYASFRFGESAVPLVGLSLTAFTVGAYGWSTVEVESSYVLSFLYLTQHSKRSERLSSQISRRVYRLSTRKCSPLLMCIVGLQRDW